MTKEELDQHMFVGKMGLIPSKTDIRDYKLSFEASDNSDIPESYESPLPKIIVNQGSAGICTNASYSYWQARQNELKTGEYIQFSPTYIYAHKDDQTASGMQLRDVLKFAVKNGLCRNELFPYIEDVPQVVQDLQNSDQTLLAQDAIKYRPKGYAQITDINNVKRAIMRYSFVYLAIPWFSDAGYESIDISTNPYDYENIIHAGKEISGYHAIMAYGFDSNGIKVVNTWGSEWSKNGTAVLSKDYPIIEYWAIYGDVEEPQNNPFPTPTPTPIIKKPSDNPIYQLIAKFVNWILNKFTKHK